MIDWMYSVAVRWTGETRGCQKILEGSRVKGGRSRRFHRIRLEILHRSIKKIIKKDWLDKKLEQLKVEPWKILRSKKIEKFSKFSLKIQWKWKILRSKIFENFRSQKFQKFSLKIVWKWKILRSKIFDFFRSQKFSRLDFELL